MNQDMNKNDCPTLEQHLQLKLKQLEQAEQEGKPKVQLIEIYKEVKELHYQLTFCKHNIRPSMSV